MSSKPIPIRSTRGDARSGVRHNRQENQQASQEDRSLYTDDRERHTTREPRTRSGLVPTRTDESPYGQSLPNNTARMYPYTSSSGRDYLSTSANARDATSSSFTDRLTRPMADREPLVESVGAVSSSGFEASQKPSGRLAHYGSTVPGQTALQESSTQSSRATAHERPEADTVSQRKQFPYTVLSNKQHRAFVEIRLEDLEDRIDYLERHIEFIAKENVKDVTGLFTKQAIDFERSGESLASASCCYCLALMHQASKGSSPAHQKKYFKSVRQRNNSARQSFRDTFESIQNIVKAQAEKEGKLDPSRSKQTPSKVGDEFNFSDLGLPSEEFEMYAGQSGEVDLETFRTQSDSSLAPAFKIRSSSFFVEGRVFAILWHEGAGELGNKATKALMVPSEKEGKSLNPNFSIARFGSRVFTHIRRMIVIRRRHGYCWCVSIGTYGGKGLAKEGLTQTEVNEHAILYDNTHKPAAYLPGEPQSNKRPIAVKLADGQKLDTASRIHLGKPFNINYNLKVMDVGRIVQEDIEALSGYVYTELFSRKR